MKKLLTSALFAVILFTSGLSFAQVDGDYQTLGSGAFNWSNAASWQKRVGGLWVGSPDYPGQNTGAGTVTILGTMTGTVTLDLSPANAIGALVVQNGTGVTDLALGAQTLSVTGAVTIAASATLDAGSSTFNVGGVFTATGTFTSGTSTVVFNGGIQSLTTGTFYNLNIQSSSFSLGAGTVTVNNNFSVTNNSTVSATVANILNVAGSFSVASGSVFSATNGTVTLNSSSLAQSVDLASGSNFFSLAFSGTAIKTANSNLDINGNVTITGSTAGLFNDGGFALTVAGNWTVASTDPANPFSNTGSVTFDGGNQTISNSVNTAITFSTVTFAGTGTKTVSDSEVLTVTTLATINSGSTLALGTTAVGSTMGGAGTLVINGQLNLYKTATPFPTIASLTVATNSLIYYVGNGAGQEVPGTYTGGTIPYFNLYVNSGSKTATGNLTVTGTLYIYNGVTLALGNHTHHFSGAVTLAGATSQITSGASGTTTLDSDDANQTLTVTTSNNAQFQNLNITLNAPTASRTKTITNNIDVRGTFSVTNTGGDVNRVLYITMGTNLITNTAGTGTAFSLGANVIFQSSATGTNFGSMINDYTTITLAADSYIYLYGAAVTIPVLNASASYGSLFLTTSGTKTAAGNLVFGGNFVMNNTGGLIFNDGGFTITVNGNFNKGGGNATYTQASTVTSNLVFSGGDQAIGGTISYGGNNYGGGTVSLYRVLFTGSGTKTLSAAFAITNGGELTIDSDANVLTANNVDFAGADWFNNAGGTFVQTASTTTFTGTGIMNIDNGVSSSYFNVFTINTATGTVFLVSDIDIHSNLNFTVNAATLDATNRTITVSGAWTRNAGTTFTSTGSTVIFDGNTQQNITVSGGSVFNNLIFRNSGTKYLISSGTTATVNGDLTIEGGATLDTYNITNLTLFGNWTNVGTFTNRNYIVTFAGTDQIIGASTFGSIVCAGSGTKTLNGNIVLSNALTINDNVTLDVSNNNYTISIAGVWNNNQTNGVFEARQGTVNFWGNGRTINPGLNTQTLANKNFYNLEVNLTAGQTLTVALDNPIDVDNDFTMITGNFTTGSYTSGLKPFTVGGNFVNTGAGTFTNTGCRLTFDGDPTGVGTINFDLNTSNMTGPVAVNIGSTDTLKVGTSFTNSYAANGTNYTIEVQSGIFFFNKKTITLSGYTSGSSVYLSSASASFYMNSDATLLLANSAVVTNAGGNVKLLGTNGAIATITRSNTTGYTIDQSSGTFEARYYQIEYLRTTGISFTGGTIDATNNFSDGTFSNGVDGSVGSQYINFGALNLGAGLTINNVVFNAGQDFNVSRTAGSTGAITFNDATGAKAGQGSENDPGALVAWNYIAVYWDGGGNGTTWEDPDNWISDEIPAIDQNVILDHSFVGGVYSVSINSAAECANLIMDAGGVNTITLNLQTSSLTVAGNLNIRALTTLAQSNGTTLNVAGNWANSGTFTANSATVTFNGSDKDATITSGGSSFYNLTINAPNSIYTLAGNAIIVGGNLTISDGTLNVSSGNLGVTVAGNWSNTGTGVFVPRSGTVTFNGSGTNQNITGGPFYNFTTSSGAGGATRTILSNIDINNQVSLQDNTTLIGGTNTIYVGASTGAAWVKTGSGSFTANTSTVIFDGGNATIDNGSASVTTFYNLTLAGTGTKTFSALGGNITNNVTVNSTVGGVDLGTGSFTVGGSFTLTGGTTLTVRQTSLPLSSLVLSSNSTVYYLSNSDQDIFATTYGNLTVGRVAASTPNKNITGTTIVTGNLNLNDAEVRLNLGNYSVSVAGNIGVPAGAGANFNTGTSTLTHNGGNWNIDTDIDGFYNLILAGTGTKTIYGIFAVGNNLTINAGVTVTAHTQAGPVYNYFTGSGAGIFTMASGATLNWSIPNTVAAFPSFGSYSLNSASTVLFYSQTESQIIPGAVTFGNLNLYYSGNGLYTKTISGSTLNVAGNLTLNSTYTAGVLTEFVTFDITGKTLNVGGNFSINDGCVFTTTSSSVNFNGTTQTINNPSGTALTYTFNNIGFSGTGTKTFGNGGDSFVILGSFTNASGSTVSTARNINFTGSTWTNSGVFTATGGTITFDALTNQSINPGTGSTFSAVTVIDADGSTGGNTKTVTGNGIVTSGVLTVGDGTNEVILDFGSLSHSLGGVVTVTAFGTWTTTNSNLDFNGNATQNIPGLTAKNVTVSRTNVTNYTKTLSGNWIVDDLTIGAGVTLDVSVTNYSINVNGNWTNNGGFTARTATVTFDSPNTTAKTITAGASAFNNVSFNQGSTSARTYTLESATTTLNGNLVVGLNAALDLNGKILVLGNNDNPDVIENHSISSGGTLDVDANSTLRFDNTDGQSTLTVANGGTLKVVGSNSSNIATVSQSAGTARALITVNGNIEARYYLFEYLADAGLVVNSGATVHATNNFSDGSWSNLTTTASGNRRYLQLDANTGDIAIDNVTFNFSGTPNTLYHFNVGRVNTAIGIITFGGVIDGTLAGLNSTTNSIYEADPTGAANNLLTWPITTAKTWVGGLGVDINDWNDGANWSPVGVPDNTYDVTIPTATNYPQIKTADASCKSLTISNGQLEVKSGFDLSVVGDVVIGSTGTATLAVSSSTSNIIVGGAWTRTATGIFTNGGSKVIFNASSGTKSINMNGTTYQFHSVDFTGGANYSLVGNINFAGTLTIDVGTTVSYATNGYSTRISGNFVNNGIFNTNPSGVTGEVFLNGGGVQNITNGTFYNFKVDNSGVKNILTPMTVINNLVINGGGYTLTAASGANISIGGTFTNLGTFNDGGASHTFAGATWTNSGTYSGTGTVTFTGNAQTINTSTFNNLVLAGTTNSTKTLGGNLTINGDLTVNNSISLNMVTYSVTGTVSKAFTFNGTTLTVTGADNFPSGFGTNTMVSTSNTNYNFSSAQSIRGGITYGSLTLNNANTKTLTGDISVAGNLSIGVATLDVSTNNYTIYISGNWTNNSTGSFVARLGEVIFNGGATQNITNDANASPNYFYKLTSSGTLVQLATSGITVTNNLQVSQGSFTLNGTTSYVGGNIVVSGTGLISQSGTLNLNATSGSQDLYLNGSSLANLVINAPGATYVVQDALTLVGAFTLTAGTFNGNSKIVSLGDGNGSDAISITGSYIAGAGGYLRLGGGSANLTVNSGGSLDLVGTPSSNVYVTRPNAGGTYGFTVNGSISARYTLFEYMNASGIKVTSAATIDATNNFSDCTFTNGTAGGSATLLKLEHSTAGMTINNVSFPVNPGGGASNVTRNEALSGVVSFNAASGSFSGESFDQDPISLISWPTPITLTWNGSISTDWYTAANWTPSSGGVIAPDATTNVIIATATNQPLIATSGANANNITINSGATLTINTTDDGTANDLSISGDLTITGIMTVTGADDIISAAGNWTKGGTGTFNNGGSTVVFEVASGAKTVNNGTANFYNLTINSVGTVNLGASTTIANNLTITAGTLDISNNAYILTIGNDWTNTGVFTARQGTVVFNKTSGTGSISAGSSAFYNITFNAGSGTVYQLTSNLSTNGNTTLSSGTLNLNGFIFNNGDGTGVDALSITSTLNVNGNSFLKMGANSTLTVNSGGRVQIVGTSESAVATVTRQSAGTYSFTVADGGTIEATYYTFEYMGVNGIQINAGGLIDATNDFDNGTFANGTTGGVYLNFLGEFSDASNHVFGGNPINDVTFNSGPLYNVRRTSGANIMEFRDAGGSLSGYLYEDDNTSQSPTTGAIRWSSSGSTFTWTGAVDTDWGNVNNWFDGVGVPADYPRTAHVDVANLVVTIPSGTPFAPTIDAADDAAAKNVTINGGATLTLSGSATLVVSNILSNSGTLIAGGSTITVGNSFTNSGTFTAGTGTVVLTSASGTKTISNGGSSLYNLTLSGASTFNLSAALTVTNNLTISAGTLDVTTNNYALNIGGNLSITGTGLLTSRSGTITMNGTGTKTLDPRTSSLYALVINKTGGGSVTLTTNNLTLSNNLTLTAGTFAVGALNINLLGTWTNTAATFTAGSGTVTFGGSGNFNLTTNNQSFNNLVVNKSNPANIITLNSNLSLTGALTVTSGTLFVNGKIVSSGNDASDNVSVGSSGTLSVDAGSQMKFYPGTTNTVTGSLSAVGTGLSNRALVTYVSAGTYNLNIATGGSFTNGFSTIQSAVIGVSGTMTVNSNTDVRLSNGTVVTVNSGGTLTAVGASTVANATVTSENGSSYYQVDVLSGGTLNAKNAIFSYVGATGGYGLRVRSGATINASNKLDNVQFANGKSDALAYLRLENNQTLQFDGMNFTGGPTYNISANTGSYIVNNYKGAFSGARYENDVVGTDGRGFVRWLFNETQAVAANTSFTFGNDLVLNFTDRGTVTSVNVQLFDGYFDPLKKIVIQRYYVVTPTGTANNVAMTQYWGANDQNGQIADATLNFWRKVGLVYTPFANNAVNGTTRLATRNALGANLAGTWFLSNAVDESSLPVEFAGSTITARRGGIEVKWETESETGNSQWRIERSTVTESDSLDFGEIGKLGGAGTTSSRSKYTYMDKSAMVGFQYKYRLVSIDYDGTEYKKDLNSVMFEAPKEFSLYHNYPNPFNPSTTIPIDVAKEQRVSMIIYNIMGQEIRTLKNEIMKPNFYDVVWDGRDRSGNIVATGQYFVRIVTDGYVKTQKMILLK
ncbi:MAG: hypothetical protein LCH54_14310 [Bacteroidetes bacterium]|nr:hypothetical protein [Bacteroidota bacterium]